MKNTTMEEKPRIGIIMGDAAGIGTEIIVKTLSNPLTFRECEPYLFGSKHIVDATIAMLGIPMQSIRENIENPEPCSPGIIRVIDCDVEQNNNFCWGTVDPLNGKNCINAFNIAFKFVANNRVDALVFGPLNKEALHRGGLKHPDESGMMKDFSRVALVKSVVKWNQLFRCTVVGHVPFSQII